MGPALMPVFAWRFHVALVESPQCFALQPGLHDNVSDLTMTALGMLVLSFAAGIFLRTFQSIALRTELLLLGVTEAADEAVMDKIITDREPSQEDLKDA